MNKVFPIEIMENSVELFRYQHLKKSKAIYNLLLLSISFLIFLMLFVKIDLFTTSPGFIRLDIQHENQPLKGLTSRSINNPNLPDTSFSPETHLIVECFISPSYVGLLNLNDQVNFQIDAFQHNQWEMANGRILHIDHDVSWIEDKLKYKVICSLNETPSILSKNTPAHIKIGMPLTAKFQIAKRTVFQLLFDKIDDWNKLK